MGSLENEVVKKKAMWLYPKALGAIPSERWGHSACYSHRVVYIFGIVTYAGCCGGLHFSDVLMLNLETMTWSTLATSGHGPGPRDSHSAILVGHRMIIFGGTNGSKKVNDLHILDLCSREWTRPDCKGTPPSPRESHTATLIGNKKLVIFGGSGEGEGNYLNDLHVLDLETMMWKSPLVKGDIPIPRDSHSTVAIENKLFVYGGDCGDRYHGGVDMFDMDTLSWSRLYILGGVGDKHYYNDVWSLDVTTCSWAQLDICGQQPQGRFSHTAIVTNSDIAIYGGCGEDERPLNELLVLRLGAEHPNGYCDISLCKTLGNHCNLERERFTRGSEYNPKNMFTDSNSELIRKESCGLVLDFKHSPQFGPDRLQPKRRKTISMKAWEIESEQEEHSLSLSQHSSPSESDQEKPSFHKAADSVTAPSTLPFLKKHISSRTKNKFTRKQPDHVVRTPLDLHYLGKHQSQPRPEQNSTELGLVQNLVGANIQGKIDGAFDSGFLMTATINGKIFRGVLFSPGPVVTPPRGAYLAQTHPAMPMSHITLAHPCPNSNNIGFIGRHAEQPMPESPMTRSSPVIRGTQSLDRDAKLHNDLHGLVLTLGGPASDCL
ncbi:hypothetical protein RJ641_023748 [Dillenia turbinata]|uniref:Uncharacterized protein n=1 Tax=Dillenia turbinata TaxID=194707 RepID=A0AAN8YT44_9MAGN